MLAVVPPIAIVEFGGPVYGVMAEIPIVVPFALNVTAGKNTEKIKLQLIITYIML